MTNSSHEKRSQPARGGPIRNAAAAGSGGPQELITAAGAAVCGVLENGVRTAYAVIDDYMRRGQEAARGIFNDPTRRGSMSDGTNYGSYSAGFNTGPSATGYSAGSNSGFNSGFNPWGNNNPMAMLFEQWMSAMRAWSQAWPGMAQGGWPQAAGFPFAAPGAQARGVAVKVNTSRPVEVTVNLYPGTDAQLLAGDALQAEGFSAAPVAAPMIARELGMVRVSLAVGAEQPAGRYRGLIRSKSGETVAGEIIVVVG